MTVPIIPAPQPGGHTPASYMQMSHHLLQKSRPELEAGDLIQASEKVSGAVAASLKAIGEQRGWRHDSHALRQAVVSQLGAELGPATPMAQALYAGRAEANSNHQNFYENFLYLEDIDRSITVAQAFIQTVEQLMNEAPKPFTVTRRLDAHRISQLTGFEPGLDGADALGFCQLYRTDAVRSGSNSRWSALSDLLPTLGKRQIIAAGIRLSGSMILAFAAVIEGHIIAGGLLNPPGQSYGSDFRITPAQSGAAFGNSRSNQVIIFRQPNQKSRLKQIWQIYSRTR